MRTRNFIKILFLICFLSVNFVYVLVPIRAAEKPSLIADTKNEDEKFDRIFREARELMDKEEWKQAAEKFNQIICNCPEENKKADAALYWLAYCYKKQKMYQETNQTIDRLLKNFPESSWADDARVLRYQTAATTYGIATTAPGQNISRPAVRTPSAVGQNLVAEAWVDGVSVFSQAVKLDREDEIKLAAFQSLLANDPKKAIEALGRLLQSDSKASETLKRQILRSLQNRFYVRRVEAFPGENTANIIVTQINPLLRDTLIKGFQNNSDGKIRAEIIYSIANINDEPSYNFLAQTYPNETNKDLKKAIINSFGGGNSAAYTVVGQAFTPLEYWDGSNWANSRSLIERVATTGAGASSGQSATANKTQTNPIRELRFNSLMTIFRTEKELELRRLAFGNIQRFAGWSNREGLIESLAQMYDSETDDKFKVSIIYSFSNLPKNAQATQKLLKIAKSDSSENMRLEAIRALRNNNSPEVIKFLEDLIN